MKLLKHNLISIILVVLGGVSIYAQTSPQFSTGFYRSAFAREQALVTSVVTVLNSSIYNPTVADTPGVASRAEYASIECDAHNIRYWSTGDSPTSGVGLLLSTGNLITLQGFHDIVNFKAISADGSTATCNVQYYRFITNTP